jgi:hypothetical protein
MNLEKRFQRKIEDFTCENCGHEVVGDGYTNHCPECFYSKHVDANPGDRLSLCKGLMEPIFIEGTGGSYFITQKCRFCEHVKKNKISKKDSFEKLLVLVEDLNEKRP